MNENNGKIKNALQMSIVYLQRIYIEKRTSLDGVVSVV